jgi:hypothetical protein
MGVLASESVAANFEQRVHIAALEASYREAAEIAEEVEARVLPAASVLAPPFQQESVPVK